MLDDHRPVDVVGADRGQVEGRVVRDGVGGVRATDCVGEERRETHVGFASRMRRSPRGMKLPLARILRGAFKPNRVTIDPVTSRSPFGAGHQIRRGFEMAGFVLPACRDWYLWTRSDTGQC